MFLLSSADFFSKLIFSKNSFRHTIKVSNALDPDQDRRSVGPDLGPNRLQRLSADDEVLSSMYSWDSIVIHMKASFRTS